MSSRISASLNHLIGVQDLLTTSSRREYVDIATRLSRSSHDLYFQIRNKIQQKLGVKIFNSLEFSQKLERVYQAMQSLHPRIGHIYHTEEARGE